jgi:hypothetical protein
MAENGKNESHLDLPIETARLARELTPRKKRKAAADTATGSGEAKAGKPKRKRMTPEEKAAWRKERDAAQAAEESLVWADIREKAQTEGRKGIKKRQGMMHGHAIYNRDKLIPIILDRLSNAEPLANICRDSDMPPPSVVLGWLAKEPSFSESYRRARETMADVLFDQCLAIADDAAGDVIENAQTGETIVNHANIARAKLRIETRFRMAGKISSKYADRGAGDGVPVTVNNVTINARDLDADQRDKLRNLLLVAKANAAGEG